MAFFLIKKPFLIEKQAVRIVWVLENVFLHLLKRKNVLIKSVHLYLKYISIGISSNIKIKSSLTPFRCQHGIKK